MPELTRNKATINYEVWGEQGPWLTLINGHTRPLNDFRLLGRHLQSLGFRILVFDNRGAGETRVLAPFTMADLVNDAVALWQLLGINSTGLLGISMGGFIAQTLALEHKNYVNTLVLVSTAASDSWLSKHEAPWTANIDEVQAKLSAYFTPGFFQRNQPLIKSMAKQIAKNVAEGDFVSRAKMQREAIQGFDARSRLNTLNCPTWVIHGLEDEIIGIKAAQELAQLIPSAQLSAINDAGHLLLAEAPKQLYEISGQAFKKNYQND